VQQSCLHALACSLCTALLCVLLAQILAFFVSKHGVDEDSMSAARGVSRQWRDLSGASSSLWTEVTSYT
jgi:hypothetical protein